jgi:hypothetical protein
VISVPPLERVMACRRWVGAALNAATVDGDPRARATALDGAAQAVRERLGEPIPGPNLAWHNEVIANLRRALGDEHYQASWDQGRSMPEQQAITLAAATPGTPHRDNAVASSD